MKMLILSMVTCLCAGRLQAQNPEEAAARATLENYMSTVPDRVEKAFDLSAHMQSLDAASGALLDYTFVDTDFAAKFDNKQRVMY